MKLLNQIACTIVMLAPLTIMRATPVQFAYEFTATGFYGPVQIISGQFGGWFEPIIGVEPYNVGEVTWIDITFDGMTFSTGNAAGNIHSGVVNGTDYSAAFQLGGIGGEDDRIQFMFSNRYDFYLTVWDGGPGTTDRMVYSTPSGDVSYANTNISFSRIPIGVPDTGSTAVLGLWALGTLAVAHAVRRRPDSRQG